jgi:hypothetical protein
MADIAQRDFTKSLFALLKETFEGPGGNTYLDKGAGLFPTLDVLTATGASHVPYVGAQTIAAHCAHLAYYVRVNHDGMMGREQRLDWPASWRPQQVGDREWTELKGVFGANMMRSSRHSSVLRRGVTNRWATAWRSSCTRPITSARFGTYSRI